MFHDMFHDMFVFRVLVRFTRYVFTICLFTICSRSLVRTYVSPHLTPAKAKIRKQEIDFSAFEFLPLSGDQEDLDQDLDQEAVAEWGFLDGWQASQAWALPAWPLFPIPLQVSPLMQLFPEEECGILNGVVAKTQLPLAPLTRARARGFLVLPARMLCCMCRFFAAPRSYVRV
jgi:hypothetical protein